MKTAINELIHFIENDRMQSTYTKEQIIELLKFKLEKEKEQIIRAHSKGWNRGIENQLIFSQQYYLLTFKSE